MQRPAHSESVARGSKRVGASILASAKARQALQSPGLVDAQMRILREKVMSRREIGRGFGRSIESQKALGEFLGDVAVGLIVGLLNVGLQRLLNPERFGKAAQ